MKHIKLTTIALSILALTFVVWTTWTVQNCKPPQQPTTYETVKAETDKAVAVTDTSTSVVDSVKLQERQNFKRRVAAAKVNRQPGK